MLGSQRTLRKGDSIWDRNDLLFVCTPDWSQFQFVHFSGEKPESALISTFGWKGPDDYKKTVLRGANTEGDSDSIACIAGGINGAYLGIGAIPDDWIKRIEKSGYLDDLATRLANKKTEL